MNLPNRSLSTFLVFLSCWWTGRVRSWSHNHNPLERQGRMAALSASTNAVAMTFSTSSSSSSSSSANNPTSRSRRGFVQTLVTGALWGTTSVATVAIYAPLPAHAAAADTAAAASLDDSVRLLRQARLQLEAVPHLIQQEKWDSVRAILITPPLADCWTKTGRRPLLKTYAAALGDADGDELAALEAREEAISHLRYLDMAVYNNVFNPIKTMGETGATEGLIRSYYEDPINEYKASVAALEELLRLATE